MGGWGRAEQDHRFDSNKVRGIDPLWSETCSKRQLFPQAVPAEHTVWSFFTLEMRAHSVDTTQSAAALCFAILQRPCGPSCKLITARINYVSRDFKVILYHLLKKRNNNFFLLQVKSCRRNSLFKSSPSSLQHFRSCSVHLSDPQHAERNDGSTNVSLMSFAALYHEPACEWYTHFLK